MMHKPFVLIGMQNRIQFMVYFQHDAECAVLQCQNGFIGVVCVQHKERCVQKLLEETEIRHESEDNE